MYLQVTNTAKTSFNQIQSTTKTLVKDIKSQGWNISDCKVKEIRPELVDTKYKGADGKNIPAGQKQYKTRAKSRNNLNMKVNVRVVKSEEAVVS